MQALVLVCNGDEVVDTTYVNYKTVNHVRGMFRARLETTREIEVFEYSSNKLFDRLIIEMPDGCIEWDLGQEVTMIRPGNGPPAMGWIDLDVKSKACTRKARLATWADAPDDARGLTDDATRNIEINA